MTGTLEQDEDYYCADSFDEAVIYFVEHMNKELNQHGIYFTHVINPAMHPYLTNPSTEEEIPCWYIDIYYSNGARGTYLVTYSYIQRGRI